MMKTTKLYHQKKYSYVDEHGNSSGKLLIPLQNFDQRAKTVGILSGEYGWWHNYTACTLYGSSYVSLSGYLTGNNVGYDRVVVESYNSSGGTNGKEISYFANSQGNLYINKIPYFLGAGNGSLVKKIILGANGDTLLTEKDNYAILPGTEISETLNAFAEDLYEGQTDVCIDWNINPLMYQPRYNIFTYPTRNYYNALNSKETTHYFPNGKVKETTNYTYNLKNYCVQSAAESTSKGVKYTNMKYPVDYSDNIHTGMASKNQINNPIEKVDSVNANVKFKVTTKDTLWNNSFYAPKRIYSTMGNNAQDERAVFDKYDPNGNLLGAHQPNNINESYYYGYNNSMPVVKGVNIDATTLYSIIQQALTASGYPNMDMLLKTVVSFPSTSWDTFNSALRKYSPNSLITTCTYDPVYGMTSSTGPNGITTYYVYDAFGRLRLVKDKDGKILKDYDYHYKQ
jgi:YD repeat-containing protein